VLWQYGFFVVDGPLPSLNNLVPSTPRAAVREAWTVAATKPAATAPADSTTPKGDENPASGAAETVAPEASSPAAPTTSQAVPRMMPGMVPGKMRAKVMEKPAEAAMSTERVNGGRLGKVAAS
jgi:hypothetical protein